ncbi:MULTISPECIES: hypothetical protein [unclassified Psychrobacter]|nr:MULTISPECIES: hypothetical protein [unclassified Psychrobacter]
MLQADDASSSQKKWAGSPAITIYSIFCKDAAIRVVMGNKDG